MGWRDVGRGGVDEGSVGGNVIKNGRVNLRRLYVDDRRRREDESDESSVESEIMVVASKSVIWKMFLPP